MLECKGGRGRRLREGRGAWAEREVRREWGGARDREGSGRRGRGRGGGGMGWYGGICEENGWGGLDWKRDEGGICMLERK